jgi:hypothetical protein
MERQHTHANGLAVKATARGATAHTCMVARMLNNTHINQQDGNDKNVNVFV